MPRTSPRLHLRPPTADDLDAVFAIYGDPQTHRFNPAGPLKDRQQARQLLEGWIDHWHSHGYGQWAIALRYAPAQVIGFGGLDLRDYLGTERLNLGYRFAASAWGQGYATELSLAALAFGFDELAVPEVYAVVRPQHQASIRVLEKVGLRRLETLNDVPGEPHSLIYHIGQDHYTGV